MLHICLHIVTCMHTPMRQTMLGWRRSVISSDSRTKSLLVFWLAPGLSVLMATSVVWPPAQPASSPLYTFPKAPSPSSCRNRMEVSGISRARVFSFCCCCRELSSGFISRLPAPPPAPPPPSVPAL